MIKSKFGVKIWALSAGPFFAILDIDALGRRRTESLALEVVDDITLR